MKKLLVSIVLLTSSSSFAAAADSFITLYNEAKAYSYELAAAQDNRDAAKFALKESWAQFFPSLSVNTSYSDFSNSTYSDDIKLSNTKGRNLRGELSLNMIIYNRDMLMATKLNKIGEQSSELILADLEQKFRTKFTTAYMNTIMAFLKYKEVEQQFNIVTTLLAKAQKASLGEDIVNRLEAAQLPIYGQLNGVKTLFLNAKNNLEIITGRTQANQTIDTLFIPSANYNFTTNELGQQELLKKAGQSALHGTESLNYWRLDSQDYGKNYSLQLAEKGVSVKQTFYRTSKRPDLTFGAILTTSDDRNDLVGGTGTIKNTARTASIYLSYNLNLFGKYYGQQKKAIEYAAARQGLKNAKQQLAIGITSLSNLLALSYDTYHFYNDPRGEKASRVDTAREELRKIMNLLDNAEVSLMTVIVRIEFLIQQFALLSQNNENLRTILATELSLLEVSNELNESYMTLFNEQIFTREMKIE